MSSTDDSAYEQTQANDGARRRRDLLLERLLRDSQRGLTDAEVLELLLSSVGRTQEVKRVAEHLVTTFGSLRSVLGASNLELERFKGLRPQAVALVGVVREIAARCSELPQLPAEVLAHPEELQRYLLARMGSMRGEAILLVFLNSQGVLLGEELLAVGTLDQTVMFPRQVMERALHYNAASLVVVHNHPHGPPLPSARDREEAERLRDVLLPFDIRVLDAIVVAQARCFSIFKNVPL
jgi:DNA repair protein RadC